MTYMTIGVELDGEKGEFPWLSFSGEGEVSPLKTWPF